MPDITPAFQYPHQPRQDGWTSDRRCIFLDALSESGSVGSSLRKAGRGSSGVYAARRRDHAFDLAWQAALQLARAPLFDGLMERAVDGDVHEIVRDGGRTQRRSPNYRLGFGLLDRIDATPASPEVAAIVSRFDSFLRVIENGADFGLVREFFDAAKLDQKGSDADRKIVSTS